MASNFNGKKIYNSEHVNVVTQLIFDGTADLKISKILEDRYSFKVSVPSVAGFRNNYYERCLSNHRVENEKFQHEQTGRVETFIDESMAQAQAIKVSINDISKQLRLLEMELGHIHKFEHLFTTAMETYLNKYNPNQPKKFLESGSSTDEDILNKIKQNLGEAGENALVTYISTHRPEGLIKLISMLNTKLLNNREALVRIHKDIFKGYRNFSIMKEMTMIFERYNGMIVEEFFPNKETMDHVQYQRLRKRIRSLFDELQIRYQGIENPGTHGKNPTEEEAEQTAETVAKDGVDPKKEKMKTPSSGRPGRPPSKSREIARIRESMAARANKVKAAKEVKEAKQSEDGPEPLDTDVSDMLIKVKENAKNRLKAGTSENLFTDLVSQRDPGLEGDLNKQSGLDNTKL